MSELVLQRNVQFMYEHALACLELDGGFGIRNPRTNRENPWRISVDANGELKGLRDRGAYVGLIDGTPTLYEKLIKPRYQGGKFNRTRSVNQYLTHWIYPYKGKFHPQMIRALLNIAGVGKGSLVADPFLGSGTTALESILLGADFVGVDVSPLCVKLSKVKTTSWRSLPQIKKVVQEFLADPETDHTKITLDAYPISVAEFLEIALMVTSSDVEVRSKDGKKAFRRNLANMLESVEAMKMAVEEFRLELGNPRFLRGDVRRLTTLGIQGGSVDAIVTSPPYSIALDYVKNDKHALTALGEDVKSIRKDFIGVKGWGAHEKLAIYNQDMQEAFGQMAKVLKCGAQLIMVVGDATVDGVEKTTTGEMVRWGEAVGLTLERILPKIVFGLFNVMVDERILFFRKPKTEGKKCTKST